MIFRRRIGHLLSAISLVVLGSSSAIITTSAAVSASANDCFSYGYACTPGYDGINTKGTWAWAHYGGSIALNANGYHNCTLYAAWRLEENGLTDPGNWGDAYQWINHAPYSKTPAVGAIAWWGKSSSSSFGHVAYVDQVNGSQVHIVADNYAGPQANGYTNSGWIAASSVGEFLHVKDLLPSSLTAVIPTSDGHIQVFFDNNGTLQENWYDPANGRVGGWSSVGGMTVQGTPALVARAGQSVIDAFVRNSAGQIVETWYNWGNGQWGGWITVNGGTFTSDPSAVATSDGHDQVFATSSGGTLAMNWFDPGSGHIGGGSSVGGMTVQGTPALVARAGQSVIDAFVRNSAGQIVETWYNWGNGQWGGWITISGATFTSAPEAVATSDGHDQVFAANNGIVKQNWFDPASGHIGNWVTI